MSIIASGTTSGTALVSTGDTNGNLVFQTNGTTTALTLSTAQAATFAGTAQFPTTIGVGGATPSTSGSGVTFPATQSASSDVNTLDDYEEGTWTPSLGGTATYTAKSGKYTKIGRMVYIQGYLEVLLIGTGNTSIIDGLPFSASGASDVESAMTVSYFNSIATSSVFLTDYVRGSRVEIRSNTAASTTIGINPIFANGTTFEFGGWYQSAT